MKITQIINVILHVKNAYENRGVKYLNTKIDDSSSFRIILHFKEDYDFIQKALTDSEEAIEVHYDVKCFKNAPYLPPTSLMSNMLEQRAKIQT